MLNQTGFLFALIFIGYLLAKLGVVERGAARSLAKLENYVFVPALIIRTFTEKFTVERLVSSWRLMLVCAAILVFTTVISIFIPRLIDKDKYHRNIYTYGFAFSNFGFMGNAVVMTLYPDIFLEYTLFTLPLWVLLYTWGVPVLLIPKAEGDSSVKSRLKSFVNPMFISLIVAIILGLIGVKFPSWLANAVSVSSDCMSPVAMLLTGIAISTIDLKATLANVKIYIASIIRLLVIPIAFILAAKLLPLSENEYVLSVCMLAMPFGLNTVIIPEAYGKDTTLATGLTLISSLLGCITIPLVLTVM